MAGSRRPARKRAQGGGAGGKIGKMILALLGDWARLTFTDRACLPKTPIRIWWVNLVLFLGLAAVFYFGGVSRTALIVAALWFLTTLGRSATIMPKRRRKVQKVYDSTCKTLGHPVSTPTRPAPVTQIVKIKRWSGDRIEDVAVQVGDCPAAAGEFTRPGANQVVSNALGPAPQGQVWIMDWPSGNALHAHLKPEGSPEAEQQNIKGKIIGVLSSIMRVNPRNAGGYGVNFDGWEAIADRQGTEHQIPGQIVVETGTFDSSLPANRDNFITSFDRQIQGPGEWIYEWDATVVSISRVAGDSPEALRKRMERKIGKDVEGALRTRAKDPASTTVTEWAEDAAWMAEEDAAYIDHPRGIAVDFGTRNMASRTTRSSFEKDLDGALEAHSPEATWLYDWHPGASTTLTMTAVETSSDEARRKRAESRLRNVVESKFGNAKTFVDCDILEWAEDLNDRGEAMPAQARVRFGDMDVTNRSTQEDFEQHWESLSMDQDWHFRWSSSDGEVIMEAVAPLPDSAAFPTEGADFEKILEMAKKGKLFIGLQKGGGWRYWDLNKVPHALVGGRTGSGKSVTLNEVLLLAGLLPDYMEVIVCDPKRTDFTWTPEFPSVITFAATDEEICAATAQARKAMDQRQSLLSRVGVRNLGQMRALYRQQPELEKKYGPVPKRLFLLFDEIADFLAKSNNKDVEELKDEARSDLESIGRLGRAMEVNIIAAAQKPDAKIISTQLRSQLGFRLGVGPLDQYESQQILNSEHGTRFPENGTPKGRAWAYDSENGYRVVQVPYIPDEDGPAPWDPSLHLRGMKPMLRARMKELGYQQIFEPNADGGQDPRWVKLDDAVDALLVDAGVAPPDDQVGDAGSAEKPSPTGGPGPVQDASREVLWPDGADQSSQTQEPPTADPVGGSEAEAAPARRPEPVGPDGRPAEGSDWVVEARDNPLPAEWLAGRQR